LLDSLGSALPVSLGFNRVFLGNFVTPDVTRVSTLFGVEYFIDAIDTQDEVAWWNI
jgi:hypothetical protein